jgi:methionyl-tRNA formyltransferase
MTGRGRVQKAFGELSAGGVIDTVLRAASRAPRPIGGWRNSDSYPQAEATAFPDAGDAYSRLNPSLIHRVADVNSPESVALIRRLEPRAVVCLGGPIYRAPLIEACGLMLNFHTGVSPLYNGAAAMDFAFANGHLHLCGGTMMTMSSVVDGGDILAHYLPAIRTGDNPATLMMKTVRGAVEAFDRFLAELRDDHAFARCRQPLPLFYYRSRDWTIEQSRQVQLHLNRDTAGRLAREPVLREYWREATDDAAGERLRSTVAELLGLT